MKVMPNRMDRGFHQYQKEFENKALEVLRSGWYVLGKEVSSFEEEFAAYVGTKHCIGVASGLDALWIAFRLCYCRGWYIWTTKCMPFWQSKRET